MSRRRYVPKKRNKRNFKKFANKTNVMNVGSHQMMRGGFHF